MCGDLAASYGDSSSVTIRRLMVRCVALMAGYELMINQDRARAC